MDANKTHYRKVFKSDHLGIADLEDYIEGKKYIGLIFKIKHVKQEIGVTVAGKKGDHNIAYFYEDIKPLVLNATNSKVVKSFNSGSPFVEDWNDTLVQLYIDPTVKRKGEIVGGVRINPKQPVLKQKKELTPDNKEVWGRAITALQSGRDISTIEDHYTLSKDNKDKLIALGAEGEADNT